jgi:hypothetical protein
MKMKTRTMSWTAALLFVGMSFATYAQESGFTPEERAQYHTDWMKADLKLTAEQEEKVHEINLKYAREAETIKSDGGSRMSKMKQGKSLIARKDADLKPILTDEQYTLYQEKKQDRKKQALDARKNRGN